MVNARGETKKGSIIFKMIRRLLRPVARFCLQRSIKFQEFEEAAKLSFLDMAAEEMLCQGTVVNTSRLAVMTGLQRREVMRLTGENPNVKEERGLLFKVLGSWEQDQRFITKNGKPRVLTVEGKNSEFSQLVTSVSKDLNPYTVLFELERVNSVERTKQGVRLVEGVFVPRDAEHGISLLSSDVDDLVLGVTENIFDQPNPLNHHITTRYDNIVDEALPKVKKWFLEKGEKFHQEARSFLSSLDRDTNKKLKTKKGGITAVLGSFSRVIKKR